MKMSLSPNSSLVRHTIDLNYANKQRSTSIKWIFINGSLFLLLTYDLWCKCPGYTSSLHYVEACCCGVLGATLLALAWALRPRRAPPRRLTRAQQRLLGLKDEDLDSSFRVVDEPAAAEGHAAPDAPDAADAPASLSPPRSWRAGRGGPRAPPEPPPADRAVRDEFIADRRALDDYLGRQERAEGGGAGGGGAPAAAWPLFAALGAPAHQLAALHAAPADSARAEAAGAAGAQLWRRLHVDPQHLTQFNLNLRRWLHATVLERLVREVDACDAALAAAGHEARVGAAAAARLAALAAAAAPPLRARLHALLPFLRPFPDQKYLVARVRELARGGCLGAYRWDAGGEGWDAARPPDAELVLHLFATYMDGVVPGGAFSAAHVSAAPAPPPRAPAALALHRAERAPPHYVLVLGEDTVEVCRGRNNLLHSLLLFLAAVARREPPALRRLHLGPAGLNMLWILGRLCSDTRLRLSCLSCRIEFVCYRFLRLSEHRPYSEIVLPCESLNTLCASLRSVSRINLRIGRVTWTSSKLVAVNRGSVVASGWHAVRVSDGGRHCGGGDARGDPRVAAARGRGAQAEARRGAPETQRCLPDVPGGAAGADLVPEPEAAARAEGPPGQGAVLRLVARQAAHRLLVAGRQGDRVGRVHGHQGGHYRHAEHVGDGVRVRALGEHGRRGRVGQQSDGVPAGRRRGGGGAGQRAQAHRGHAHVLHVVLPVPQHGPPDPDGQRRRHVRAVGRGVGPAAAELPGARGRRDGARPGALRHGGHVRVGRLRPRRARVGHAHGAGRAGVRRARLGRDQRALPPVRRLARLGRRRLGVPAVRPARRPRGGALRPRERHLRRQLGRVVGVGPAAVRRLLRLHGVRVGRATGRARVRAVRPRAPRVARAALARRHRARHRLLGRHAADLGVSGARWAVTRRGAGTSNMR